MRLDLRDVVNTPEARKPFQFQLDLSEIELYGRRPIANPVLVEGCVTNHAGALVLEGTARSTLELACDRCGREFSREKIVRLESLPSSWRTRKTTRSCFWITVLWIRW